MSFAKDFRAAMKRNVEQYGLDPEDSADAIMDDLEMRFKDLKAELRSAVSRLKKIEKLCQPNKTPKSPAKEQAESE